MERLNPKIGPGFAIKTVLSHKIGLEINQDNTGTTGNVPSPHPHTDTLSLSLFDPRLPHGGIFLKQGIFLSTPKVGANENQTVVQSLLQRLGSCGKHCVNAPYFITDFPTGFEHEGWDYPLIIHQDCLIWPQR